MQPAPSHALVRNSSTKTSRSFPVASCLRYSIGFFFFLYNIAIFAQEERRAKILLKGPSPRRMAGTHILKASNFILSFKKDMFQAGLQFCDSSASVSSTHPTPTGRA